MPEVIPGHAEILHIGPSRRNPRAVPARRGGGRPRRLGAHATRGLEIRPSQV